MTDPDAASYEMPELPKPVHFANYRGNRTNMIGGIYGPNQWNELMVAVDVKYDPATDRSRVGFAYATTPLIQGAFLTAGGIEIADTARRPAALALARATKEAA